MKLLMTSKEQIRLSNAVAPSFREMHRDIKCGGHTHYWLPGGRGSTKSSFVGIEIPLGMIVIVCVALVADWLIGMMMRNLPGIALPFTYTVLIGPLVIVWYVIGELGSLAEHAVHMGAPAPEWLPKILAAGKSAVDAAGDKIVGDEHHEEV